MGKQLLLKALQGQKTERHPWVPFVGCHGGALTGRSYHIDATSEQWMMSERKDSGNPANRLVMIGQQFDRQQIQCAFDEVTRA